MVLTNDTCSANSTLPAASVVARRTMPYVSSSGRMYRLDGPNRPIFFLLRPKPLLVAAALILAWLALGQQGSAIRAAEASRTRAVPSQFEALDFRHHNTTLFANQSDEA